MSSRRGTVIRHDAISLGLTLIASSLLIFLAPLGKDIALFAVVALVLNLAAITLSERLKVGGVDPRVTRSEVYEMPGWIAFCLVIFVLLAVVITPLPKVSFSALTYWLSIFGVGYSFATTSLAVSRMLGLLIAVSEENFFRALFANLFMKSFGVWLGIGVSGIVFGLFHIPAYLDPATGLVEWNTIFLIMMAGMALTYAAVKTRRVSTPAIAHVINNLSDLTVMFFVIAFGFVWEVYRRFFRKRAI